MARDNLGKGFKKVFKPVFLRNHFLCSTYCLFEHRSFFLLLQKKCLLFFFFFLKEREREKERVRFIEYKQIQILFEKIGYICIKF